MARRPVPPRLNHVAISSLLVALVVPLQSPQPAVWKDPSSHVSRFIPVGQDVRLEVLDWGGAGKALVLLAGGGDTAHVFDDFAPKLTNDFHVYGITRRGFGESGFAPLTSGADTFGDDVLAVLDALKLESPVLVGHSIGGQELSSIGTRQPNRIAALVYLDAAYPYAFDNGKVPTFKEISAIGFPQPPPPTEADLATFDGLRQVLHAGSGIHVPGGRTSSEAFRHAGRARGADAGLSRRSESAGNRDAVRPDSDSGSVSRGFPEPGPVGRDQHRSEDQRADCCNERLHGTAGEGNRGWPPRRASGESCRARTTTCSCRMRRTCCARCARFLAAYAKNPLETVVRLCNWAGRVT